MGMIESLYETLFGPADQGHADIAALGRPSRPNTALVAPEGFVAGRRVDAVAPIFARPAAEVRAALTAIALAEPHVEQVHADPAGVQDRFVQRSAAMRFPDTVDVRYVDLGDGRSTIALYSRAQLGYRDFGVNLARIERWLGKLQTKLG